ncbi:metal dependent phosphohydrolase with GAF sensor [Desulfofundulus kuznetsovii DSM 6115]|uniref:Metal dependent phosphohydrolase with GAF sensor n=1 Tax=Desulfofundulus kuznetsovii (strain DSM 6115 / VKM B-1805 / 17) TaxID=760568 RepID=A0AAU8PDY8_DESK7|nr:metal dependent phosphohydrolase with GAF sensor [Desulfofundulus kuznetsovii DSM 6115]
MSTGAEQWQAILQISRQLNSQLEIDALLELVLEKMMEVVSAEAGTLWILEEDGYLAPLVARGPRSEALKGLRLLPGEGLAGQVVVEDQPRLVPDVRNDPAWARRFDDSTGFVTRSLLCIPLRARKGVIGCLQLVNKRQGESFTPDDLEVALALAGQAAIALENSRLYNWQRQLLNSLIRVLASALDARDPYTSGHSERVSRYAVLTGREMGLPPEELEALERAALLHDVGKIGIRDNVLLKEGPLEPEKWQIMKTHTEIGARILGTVEPHHLAQKMYEGALYHQEKYDGSGYPTGIKGEEIPLVARIIAVADTFDAITTDRPYRKGASFHEALKEIRRCSGTHFDPAVVEAFIRGMSKTLPEDDN